MEWLPRAFALKNFHSSATLAKPGLAHHGASTGFRLGEAWVTPMTLSTRSPSPFAVLGLPQGASRGLVEAAYRRLMKQYHPDRSGGDPVRAAEINRAYAAIRAGDVPDAVQIDPPIRAGPRRPSTLPFVSALAGVIAAFAWLMPWDGRPSIVPLSQAMSGTARDHIIKTDDLPVPDMDAIEEGVAEALRVTQARDADAAARFSQACHRDVRRVRSAVLVDHCLAFDVAIPMLHDAAGPAFAGDAVARRASDAVGRLTNDRQAGEERLFAIRRVTANAILAARLPLRAIDASGAEKP